jgi:hypothetical protein
MKRFYILSLKRSAKCVAPDLIRYTLCVRICCS